MIKAHHRHLKELWSQRDGCSLFRATMSLERFEQLKAALRFDDPLRRDREERIAAIRSVVDTFNDKMLETYTPGPYLTIDEMLVEFHGRVGFKQFIPTKPGKFGIKVFWVVDAENTIPLKCIVFTGSQTLPESERDKPFSYAITKELMKPFAGKGRNVTADNYFCSSLIANDLLSDNTTIVGTIRQNRKEIPSAAKDIRDRVRGDSRHYYSSDLTLCSFWDKSNSPVLLISTLHGYQHNTISRDSGKPDIVRFYNETKSGVDNLDKLVRGYSSKRKSRRWPVHLFFTLVDCAVLVALRMMQHQAGSLECHYDFKKELAYELCLPLIIHRSSLPGLRQTVKDAMSAVGVTIIRPDTRRSVPSCKGRCKMCPRSRDRKTKTKCFICGMFLCADHVKNVCDECS